MLDHCVSLSRGHANDIGDLHFTLAFYSPMGVPEERGCAALLQGVDAGAAWSARAAPVDEGVEDSYYPVVQRYLVEPGVSRERLATLESVTLCSIVLRR